MYGAVDKDRTQSPAFELPKVDGNSARVYALVARSADKAVVLRRGPSNATRMLLWNLKTDTIEEGQWIRAHIYERRCDLSPDGKFLVYFAANHRPPFGSWTAISRPPWFTALALWEKGDCWGGGGLFETPVSLRLNHRPQPYHPGIEEWRLQEGFRLPKSLRVKPLHEGSGWGEDHPIETMRLERDGWRFEYERSERTEHARGERFWLTFDPPLTRVKEIARSRRGALSLRVHLHAVNETQSRWLVETADIVDAAGVIVRDLGRIDWADADHNGDVLYAAEGCLYRLRLDRSTRDSHNLIALTQPKRVADLNPMTFEPLAPPPAAKKWR
ncbi:MAG: hypothetical protein FJX29_04310 [Alphaproteobacteria bacterium]|nr:hypothetical protein [Alphaproteobacteria bacterium]